MWSWLRNRKIEPVVISVVNGDDFSSFDSRERAEDGCREGKLSLVYLMPREAGGPDGGPNVAYVPAYAKREKERIDGGILDAARTGAKIHYETNQSYKGSSFVPSQIVISVSGDLNAKYILEVW